MNFLLDTVVVSEIRKKVPNVGVQAWFASVSADQLYLSVLVVGKIRERIERLARRDPRQAEVLELWLEELVDVYSDRIVPVTLDVAERCGRLDIPNRALMIDGLLAATALVYDWTLVTRNGSFIASTGVRLLDPFEA